MEQGRRKEKGRRARKRKEAERGRKGGKKEGWEGRGGGGGGWGYISTPGLTTSHLVAMYVPVVFSVSRLLCSGCVGSCRSTAGILLV